MNAVEVRPSFALRGCDTSVFRILTLEAAGKTSLSPEPEKEKTAEETEKPAKPKSQLPPRMQLSAKRKLVGRDSESDSTTLKADKEGVKKKKKGGKKLLSFDQED